MLIVENFVQVLVSPDARGCIFLHCISGEVFQSKYIKNHSIDISVLESWERFDFF